MVTEAVISELQLREDWDSGLTDGDLVGLQGKLSFHHSLIEVARGHVEIEIEDSVH